MNQAGLNTLTTLANANYNAVFPGALEVGYALELSGSRYGLRKETAWPVLVRMYGQKRMCACIPRENSSFNFRWLIPSSVLRIDPRKF